MKKAWLQHNYCLPMSCAPSCYRPHTTWHLIALLYSAPDQQDSLCNAHVLVPAGQHVQDSLYM